MQIKASTVAQHLRKLSVKRRQTIDAVREVILKNIDTLFAEGMQCGMISYYAPHSVFPEGYHCNPEQPYHSQQSQRKSTISGSTSSTSTAIRSKRLVPCRMAQGRQEARHEQVVRPRQDD